jgi:hypothetical protein
MSVDDMNYPKRLIEVDLPIARISAHMRQSTMPDAISNDEFFSSLGGKEDW